MAKKKILLQSCCAPCSTAVIERLADTYDITILYYNPNIYPEEEYLKRKIYSSTSVLYHSTVFSTSIELINELENVVEQDGLGEEPQTFVTTKVGRNEPCPCGSGKKFKNCCGK